MMTKHLKIVGFVSIVFFCYALNSYAAPSSQNFSTNTLDEQFAGLSRQLPGFAGAFFGENNSFVIAVTQDSEYQQPENIKQALLNIQKNITLPILGHLIASTSNYDLVVRNVKYDFASLHKWRTALSKETMSDPNVEFIDTDEKQNRIVIGVSKTKEQYLASMSALNIPADAVIIENAPAAINTNNRAQEPATYDGHMLNIPLVEVNDQYYSDVKVMLNEDGTWKLQGVSGSDVNAVLFDSDSESYAPELKVLTRNPDNDFAFQAIARVSEWTGDKSCTALIALPQQVDGNIITVAITIIQTTVKAACTASLARRSIDIKLDTEGLSPGTYIVKYRDKLGEFTLP